MASKGRKNSPKIDLRFQSKLKKILRILSENDIFFENLILFGSVARGDAREDSDIDLCLIVDDKIRDLQTIRRAATASVARAGIDADFVITSIHKYKNDMISPLLHQIRTHGIPVF